MELSALKENIKIRNDKMAEAISSDCDRDLWLEVKKMGKNNSKLPNIIDNSKGSENISKLFHDKNKELYNSVGFDNNEMATLVNEIDYKIKHNNNSDKYVKITVENVKDAIKELKTGKQEEVGLYTDHFKHAPDRLIVLLTMLFNSMLIHGMAPDNLLVGTMTPIVKNYRESHNKSSNYRTLTIGTGLAKLLDLIIIRKQKSIFNTSELQFGFKGNSSTTMCSFMVQETISHYVANGSNVNILMLDASKAFDRVHYVKLFKKLINKGMCPVVVRLLLSMYVNQKLQVKWNNVMSQRFNISNGVRQGGIMSPLLFGVYIDELMQTLKANGIGCYMGHYYCGAFGYADDIILLCPSVTGLEAMIKVCEQFAHKHNILFNGKKSKFMIYGKHGGDPNIKVNGEKVPMCTDADYLGNRFSTLNKDSMIEAGVKNFNSHFNYFMTKFSTCRIPVKNKLFGQYCCSYYGSQLWPLYNDKIKDIHVKWRTAIRRLWNLPHKAHCNMLPLISEQYPIDISLISRFCKFFKSIIDSKNQTLSYVAKMQSENCRSVLGQNISFININYNISRDELIEWSNVKIKKLLYSKWLNKLNDEYIIDSDRVKEIILMNDYFSNDFFTDEERKFIIEKLCTS